MSSNKQDKKPAPREFYNVVDRGLYIANLAAINGDDFVFSADITLAINVSGAEIGVNTEFGPTKVVPVEGMTIKTFTLSSQTLMDYEIIPFISQLKSTVTAVKAGLAAGERVAVFCDTGRDRAALVVAAFLVQSGRPVEEVISRIERIYFTPQQINDEAAYIRELNSLVLPEDMSATVTIAVSDTARTLKLGRDEARALNNPFHRSILRKLAALPNPNQN